VEAVDTLCRIEKRLTFSCTAGPLFYSADWPCFSHSALSPSLGYSQAPFFSVATGRDWNWSKSKNSFETRSLAVKDAVKHAVTGHAFVVRAGCGGPSRRRHALRICVCNNITQSMA